MSNTNNFYEPTTIAKEVSDREGQFVRVTDVRSVVDNYYTHFRATYNISGIPTQVLYYRGTVAHRSQIGINGDIAGSLNNKYFSIRSAPDNKLYHIWFNVDGLGIDPAPVSSTGIEVAISANDPAVVVAVAINLTINNLFGDIFYTTRQVSVVEIATKGLGLVTNSVDFNTGFVINNIIGEQELVSKIDIEYSGSDPIYQGQVLKEYSFDIYSGKFLKNPELAVNNVTIADSDGDQLAINPDGSIDVNVISTGQELLSYYSEVTGVATGVTTELVSYTAVSDVYLQKIEFCGTNIAEFELTIDGITKDKKRTFYNGNLENRFEFNQGLNILTGQVIKVYVVHNRPNIGEFNARTQILQGI